MLLISQKECVPEEQVGQNWGFVAVRAAAKRQLSEPIMSHEVETC